MFIKHIFLLVSVRKWGEVGHSEMVKRNIKERRKEGDWGGILFETSHISLWIVTHTSFSWSPLLYLGSEAEETHGFTPTHWLQLEGTKGLNYLCAPLACEPSRRDLARAPGPGLALTGSWGALGGRRAPRPCRARTPFCRTRSLTTPLFVAAVVVVHSTGIKGFRCL